jgi:hypothetical protein
MWRGLILFSGVAVLTGFGITNAPPRPVPQARVVPVAVNVQCTGGRVQFDVNPWVVEIRQGDGIDWQLAGNASSPDIEISPATPGRWPFQGPTTVRGNRGRAAQGRSMKPNQRGQRFKYNIRLSCAGPGGEQYEVIIDPDIKVGDE